MARETAFTAIIPAILIFFLVFFNIRKNAEAGEDYENGA